MEKPFLERYKLKNITFHTCKQHYLETPTYLRLLFFKFNVPSWAWDLAVLDKTSSLMFFSWELVSKNIPRPPSSGGWDQPQPEEPTWRTILGYIWDPIPFIPLPVLSYNIPCTWVCPNTPRSSGLMPWVFLRSWTNPGSRRASWEINCSCCLVSSFFHRIMWVWAARMALTWLF